VVWTVAAALLENSVRRLVAGGGRLGCLAVAVASGICVMREETRLRSVLMTFGVLIGAVVLCSLANLL
jgi:hypothetical protein